MLDQAIAHGVASVPNAPASLLALFEDIERDPEWLDPERIELGARVFRRYGTAVFRFAGAITLEGYSESSVAKPLVLTGAYAGGSTKTAVPRDGGVLDRRLRTGRPRALRARACLRAARAQ